MGCVNTTVKIVRCNNGKQRPAPNLSILEISLIEKSWDILKANIDTIGLVIFKRFLLQSKHLEKLFEKRFQADQDSRCGDDQIQFADEKIRDHGRIVMEALGSAVECLHDCEQLDLVLRGIGERHTMYGVKQDMLSLLWPPIISTFIDHLGSTFTPHINKAWESLYIYICNKVAEGMVSCNCKEDSIIDGN